MRINIIIPNYNGADLISKNLLKVVESLEDYPDSKIIIVDDGSDLPDYEKLREFINSLKNKKIELIRKEKNSGFSSTVNKGTFSQDSDFLVFLNSDVVPEKDFLSRVVLDFEINKNLFGIGFLDKSKEGEKIVFRGRGEAFWKRGFLVHKKGDIDRPDTFWISGGSSIVRSGIFKELGGFDEIYDPFYWEDIDVSYRARKLGYEIMFEKESIVIHRHSEGAIRSYYSNQEIRKISYRNQFIFIWKNIADPKLLINHILWLPYHMFRNLLNPDLAFFQGFLLALLKLPVIISKRNKQKKLYKSTDLELIEVK